MKRVILFLILAISVVFADGVSIKSSYQKALKYEASVQSNQYQVYAKKEDIAQTKSRLYPKIDMQVSGTVRDYTISGTGVQRDEQYYTATLSSQVPIYHPENYNMIEQSRMKYRFSNLYLNQLKQELAFNVTDAFVSIIRAKNSLRVAKAYLEVNKTKYEQIKKKFKERLANKMDLLESRVTYEQSNIKVSSEKRNLSLAKYKFKNLTGIKDIKIPDVDLENIDISRLSLPYKRDDLLALNMEIKKSNINIALTKKEIKNTSYNRYPKVDLSASFSMYDSSSIYTDYKRESRVMLTAKVPLFDGGYTSSREAQYRYLLSAANEDLKDTQRKVLSKYDEFIVNFKTSQENINLYKETIASSKLYLYAVTRGYESGLKNLVDVEDAKAKLFEAKFKLIDSVYQFIKAYTSLLNLYGVFDDVKLEQLDLALFRG